MNSTKQPLSREVSEHIKIHRLVAEQLEQAVFHNKQAAKFYNAGDIDKGDHHAHLAEGYYIDAGTLIERLSSAVNTITAINKTQKRAYG